MSLPSRLLGANPSIQVSTLLSGSLSTPSAKQGFIPPTSFSSIATASPSGTSTLTFSSIPSTYQHLQIRYYHTTSVDSANLFMRINGSATGIYTRHRLRSNGSAASSIGSNGNTSWVAGNSLVGSSAVYPEVGIMDIHDYASVNKNKTMKLQTGMSPGAIEFNSGLWMSTDAISSITIFIDAGTWSVSSIFALYGIANS
jgi:hypothetical protein